MRGVELGLMKPQMALPLSEAARRLGVAANTLWGWSRAGRVLTVRVGGMRLFPVEEIERLRRERGRP